MEVSKMDAHAVRKAYARWAPTYDWSFGWVSEWGRRQGVKTINSREGRVLEVGIGTGLSLPRYADHLEITGIDLSTEMLQKARERVKSKGLKNVAGIHEMDASALTFPDGYFETVVAMYVMTVVPDPKEVMAELERVCAPGGKVILVNHFMAEKGPLRAIEKGLAEFSPKLGWRSDFPMEMVFGQPNLKLTDVMPLAPAGIFTMLQFDKASEGES